MTRMAIRTALDDSRLRTWALVYINTRCEPDYAEDTDEALFRLACAAPDLDIETMTDAEIMQLFVIPAKVGD